MYSVQVCNSFNFTFLILILPACKDFLHLSCPCFYHQITKELLPNVTYKPNVIYKPNVTYKPNLRELIDC